ncbi:helix-turn-helix domain-containing protein [Algoriphagus pacificus]|uniref:Helix-turn-helix domain-containing protein n=1 Tax=Algoriphagus pacificus TaxID=2811234 RepID=A0ABS3CHD4_9BACT|nr:helix-turn-helix domain-containing protein [Algoriphagus pacificus]MBN7815650.1 helix-turn-helix domain-containing protein [Algoriphagus pacificus]
MKEQSSDKLEFAAKFVNNTGAPIFLTGKAGTGKTTFLRDLAKRTHKRHVILAPTGIAALHAKGVTIHSQFLLPLGSFLPVREPEGNFTDQYGFYTQHTLSRRHPLNQLRKSVLKAVELLVIDEVSMLRADVLDAIDYRMKSVKGNFREPFGGVQVLMIGDLYQLPPIVKDHEWQVLNRFYNSMHFFEAKALQNSGLVYLELDKIFRQQDDEFINVLNHLRDNQVTQQDVDLLNKHFKSAEEIKKLEEEYITITTHNYKADQINQKEMESLSGKSFFFDAEVEGEFPDSLYPLPDRLELREGAQIMFVKNDSSGNASYFNGKIAKVIHLEKDEILVQMQGTDEEYTLRKEVWENKKYIVNQDTKELDEEVIGTFSQYPIKLAWAVTVHKSQGLTFDRAIIDVGQAFAPGQVYVALSRLRSLDGLVLRSRIQSNLVYSDHQVVNFSQSAGNQLELQDLLQRNQSHYLGSLVDRTFDLRPILKELETFQKEQNSSLEFEDAEMQKTIPEVYQLLSAEVGNTEKFRRQLLFLLQENESEKLQERIQKGGQYYRELIANSLKKILSQAGLVEQFSRTKKYLDGLESVEESLLRKYVELSKLGRLIEAISSGNTPGRMEDLDEEILSLRRQFIFKAKEQAAEKIKGIKSKTGRKKSGGLKPKRQKGDSFEVTYLLYTQGKTIEEISKERSLAQSTIKSHLAHGIETGRVELENCLPEYVISEIKDQLEKQTSMTELREYFNGKYDYGTIKMVIAGNKVGF